MDTLDLEALALDWRKRHGCHTLILYGSQAQGTATPVSDIDVVGFRDTGPACLDARDWQGRWLDGWIYPNSAAETPGDFLQLAGGRILCERDGFGRNLLEKLAALLATPPEPWTSDVRQQRRVWLTKTLARAQQADAEALYRRHWLMADLLEIHLGLRHQRFMGFKPSMRWLAAHDPIAHQRFLQLYSPDGEAHLAEIVAWVLQSDPEA
ncbi:MAG: hypothetical protein ACO1RX_21675 [Candidatus Sericytochromatia bacterium]